MKWTWSCPLGLAEQSCERVSEVPVSSAILQFALSAAAIIVAGTVLTRCADAIADLTKLGRLLVGSVFLAAATSLPELTVDISAVSLGMSDLAVGDLMGSSLFNLLILAVLDLTHRSRGKMLSRASAAHALSATMSISLTTLAAISIFLGEQLARATTLRLNVGSWAILIAYVLGVRLVFYDQRFAAQQLGKHEAVIVPAGGMTLPWAVAGFVLSAVVILMSGPFLARAADQIAESSGLGRTFMGTTFVALSTSLPELVASLTAVRMGAFDLALGNIFGSNSFNMLLLCVLDLFNPGSLYAAIAPAHALTGMATILVTAIAVMAQLYQAEKRVRLVEPDALLLIVLIVGALVLLYIFR
jgi:cation:H+ antiporter